MNNLEYLAQYRQQDLLQEAHQARLARMATEGTTHAGHHHRLTAGVLAMLMVIALVLI